MFAGRILGDTRGGFATRDSLPRAWATINGGTGALINSFNVSALTDNAAGDFTLTWQLAFQATEYVAAGVGKPTGGNMACMGVSASSAPSSTSLRVFYRNADAGAVDTPVGHVVAVGRV